MARQQVGPFMIPNPNPEMHYSSGSIDSMILGSMMAVGYKPILQEEANKLFGPELAKYIIDAHGYVRFKECVLMQIPKEAYAAIEYEEFRASAEARQLPVDKFLEEIDRLGPAVKAFAMSKGEYMERKAVETREGGGPVVVPQNYPTRAEREKEFADRIEKEEREKLAESVKRSQEGIVTTKPIDPTKT